MSNTPSKNHFTPIQQVINKLLEQKREYTNELKAWNLIENRDAASNEITKLTDKIVEIDNKIKILNLSETSPNQRQQLNG